MQIDLLHQRRWLIKADHPDAWSNNLNIDLNCAPYPNIRSVSLVDLYMYIESKIIKQTRPKIYTYYIIGQFKQPDSNIPNKSSLW